MDSLCLKNKTFLLLLSWVLVSGLSVYSIDQLLCLWAHPSVHKLLRIHIHLGNRAELRTPRACCIWTRQKGLVWTRPSVHKLSHLHKYNQLAQNIAMSAIQLEHRLEERKPRACCIWTNYSPIFEKEDMDTFYSVCTRYSIIQFAKQV